MADGTAVGYGIGQGLQEIGDALARRFDNQALFRETQADELTKKGLRIATNLQQYEIEKPKSTMPTELPAGQLSDGSNANLVAPRPAATPYVEFGGRYYHPKAATLIDQLKQTSAQVRGLFGPHETPALIQHFRKFLGKAPKPPTPNPRAEQYSPEGFISQVPVTPFKWSGEAGEFIQLSKLAADPNQPQSARAAAVAKLQSINAPTEETWTPFEQPYEKDSQTYQRFRNPQGQVEERVVPGPGQAKKPLAFSFHPQTGGLTSITDPNSGAVYDVSNLETSPPEIQQRWNAIQTQQQTELKRKEEAEALRQRELEERQIRAINAAADRQMQGLQNAFDRGDYTTARKYVAEADDKYQDALDRMNKMDLNAVAAAKGDGQADVSLLFNHIGMTLSAQSGARITNAEIDRAIKTRSVPEGLLATWDKVSQGTFLSPAQRKQMVDLAHESVNILQQRKARVSSEYADVLKLNQPSSPGALKDKAKPAGTNPVDDIVNELQKLKP